MSAPTDLPTSGAAVGSAAEVLARCAELDLYSSHPEHLERVYLSPEHAAVNRVVARWMTRAGLAPRQDAAGNQYGRREGREPGLPALLLGSHLDTVPDAGSYDGMLGVLMGIAVAERLGDRVDDLPFALEVVGFSDEEGTRFGKALLGSCAAAGTWDPAWWDLCDAGGMTLRTAFEEFGLDPRAVGTAARRPDELVGYLEAHIEQGPYLEEADASLGYVTTIAGARRFVLEVEGEARHAGGTPYDRRKDAMVGAAECITAIERMVRPSGCIATTGRIEARPGAVNVIAGHVEVSLDLRAATDEALLSPGVVVSGGSVTRSVLSPDVRVEDGADVTGSVLLNGVTVGAGAVVRNTILDKNVVVPPGASIGVDAEADQVAAAEREAVVDR
ncbi:hydantoinase/carbamoylase family amidase, partial [Aeromicrobium sp. REDSEA-S38_B2]|uniref:Zn-dependent hydrolase n=1 Tax=Aeromicrobium sp. REDSEA-S38_B2 TaxID=1811528 RepID=UPI000A4A45A2